MINLRSRMCLMIYFLRLHKKIINLENSMSFLKVKINIYKKLKQMKMNGEVLTNMQLQQMFRFNLNFKILTYNPNRISILKNLNRTKPVRKHIYNKKTISSKKPIPSVIQNLPISKKKSNFQTKISRILTNYKMIHQKNKLFKKLILMKINKTK